MQTKKQSRRALFLSIISVILCCAMLVGTTMAWFTDEVQSGTNTIVAGNLDIELYHSDKDENGKVDATTKLFNDVTLWEPGAVMYENFEIKNVGNLALTYQMALKVKNATSNGKNGTLVDVLKVAIVEGGFNGDREDAKNLKNFQTLSSFVTKGDLIPAQSDEVGIVVYWQPGEKDNDYNMNNGQNKTLQIDLGIELVATQLMAEKDSFDETYDDLAKDMQLPEVKVDVYNTASLAQALANGATAVLGQSFTMDDTGDLEIPEGVSAAIDLNGHTLSTGGNSIVVEGDLAIAGTNGGTVLAEPSTGTGVAVPIAVLSGGYLNIQSGVLIKAPDDTFAIVSDANTDIRISEGAIVEMTGGREAIYLWTNGWGNSGTINLVVEGKIKANEPYPAIRQDAGESNVTLGENVLEGKIQLMTDAKMHLTYAGNRPTIVDASGNAADPESTAVATNYEGLTVLENNKNAVSVTSAAGLANIDDYVAEQGGSNESNTFSFDLKGHIDMQGATWTPLDNMFVTLNGNGYTISNVNFGKNSFGQSGLFGHAGAVTINDLTLKNVTATGSQAGAFAGNAEGLTLNDCKLAGENYINFTATSEAYNGIGAITGVVNSVTVTNTEIVTGATVKLNYGSLTTVATYRDTLTGYLNPPTGTVTNNGDIYVEKTVLDDATLQATLMEQNATIIEVTMGDDLTLPVDHATKLGGDKTTSVMIHGGDHILTLGSTYIATLNTKNPDATLTLNNLTLTRTDTNDKNWNIYDITFYGNTVLNEVDVDQAVALIGEGKDFSLKNVSITENSGDFYALWISANGADVDIDGLTIESTGRGIKIDESYVTPALVDLTIKNATFDTVKKAAIIVKSAKGANITAENLDITNVYADPINAVWVDEDAKAYADLVTVSGCTKIVEGTVTYIRTAADLVAFEQAVNGGDSYKGKTAVLLSDIDLAGIDWNPIGQTGSTTFQGNFDGNNKTISNLSIDSDEEEGKHYSSGLFGWVEIHGTQKTTIKNVKVDGATVNGHHNCAVIAGYATGYVQIENCHVSNAAVSCTSVNEDANGDKAGVIAGNGTGEPDTKITNCSATSCTVSAGRDAGQIVGAAKTANVTGCTATNVAVSANGTSTSANISNDIIGRIL